MSAAWVVLGNEWKGLVGNVIQEILFEAVHWIDDGVCMGNDMGRNWVVSMRRRCHGRRRCHDRKVVLRLFQL